MRDLHESNRFRRTLSVLDLIATCLVIVAAAAMLVLTVTNWNMRGTEHNDGARQPTNTAPYSSLAAARRLRLDLAAFSKCMNGSESIAQLEDDISSAKELGVLATPMFLVGRVIDGGMVKVERVLLGMTSFEGFRTVFDELAPVARTSGHRH